MNSVQWNDFVKFRNAFKRQINSWKAKYPAIADEFIYNKALDDIKKTDDIKYILVGDNPGVEEKKFGRYFVETGDAGKRCRDFFKNELGIADFDHSVIVLNKTPIYTPATADLISVTPTSIVEDTQTWMAEQIAQLHRAFECPLWIVGLSELEPKKLFAPFAHTFKYSYPEGSALFSCNVFVFKHFAYGHFEAEYGSMKDAIMDCPSLTAILNPLTYVNIADICLRIIGGNHREAIFSKF